MTHTTPDGPLADPQPRIRLGQAPDNRRLAALATQVWLHTYATAGVSEEIAQYVGSELTPQRFAHHLADPTCSVWVAERAQHLLGFAVVGFDTPCPADAPATTSELRTLYVQTHAARQGLGHRLLAQAAAHARSRTGSPLLWLTVNAMNANALAFYAAHGYRRVGRSDFVLGRSRHENHVLVGPDGEVTLGPWPLLSERQRDQVRALRITAQQIEFAGDIERIIESATREPSDDVAGLAIFRAGEVVGFVVVKRGAKAPDWVADGGVVVSGMRIDQALQGQGMGSRALLALGEWVTNHWPGCRALTLSVDEENQLGIRAYQRAGFIDAGRREQGRIGWVRFMSKTLTAPATRTAQGAYSASDAPEAADEVAWQQQ